VFLLCALVKERFSIPTGQGIGLNAAYEADLKQWLRIENVTVIHTRDRKVADSEDFVKPLLTAAGAFSERRKCRAIRPGLSRY
jgi:hypothetical protein